jgi:hypothetical protein
MLFFFRLHFRDGCVQHIENLCIIGLTGDLTEQLPIRVILSLGEYDVLDCIDFGRPACQPIGHRLEQSFSLPYLVAIFAPELMY